LVGVEKGPLVGVDLGVAGVALEEVGYLMGVYHRDIGHEELVSEGDFAVRIHLPIDPVGFVLSALIYVMDGVEVGHGSPFM